MAICSSLYYSGLRGHEYTVEVNRIRLNIKNVFSNIISSLWNSLSECVILSPDVDTFKKNYSY